MPLADSKEAIGAVTELLHDRLTIEVPITVEVGGPEAAAKGGSGGPKLNLFLYEVDFDGHLRNFTLDEGQPAPLWVVLKYLLTAFDDHKESDSAEAHKLLGKGLAVLQQLNFLQPTAVTLADNPEPLKITFDTANVELLSKIMQGSDEKYRISAAFQVRPVMIAPKATPSYAPAVKTVGPPGKEGVVVLPSVGPRLTDISPERFEVTQTITLTGQDIGATDFEAVIGSVAFPLIPAGPGKVQVTIPLATTLSAGSYPVAVARVLPSGRRFSSNALLGHLRPTLDAVTVGPLTPVAGKLFGDLTLTGKRLGGPDDSIFVALYKDGAVALMLEPTGAGAQTSLLVSVSSANALPPGQYLLILRVNSEQAVNSPQVNWT